MHNPVSIRLNFIVVQPEMFCVESGTVISMDNLFHCML